MRELSALSSSLVAKLPISPAGDDAEFGETIGGEIAARIGRDQLGRRADCRLAGARADAGHGVGVTGGTEHLLMARVVVAPLP